QREGHPELPEVAPQPAPGARTRRAEAPDRAATAVRSARRAPARRRLMPPSGFPELGGRRQVRRAAGPLAYHERGEGPPLVFVHGVFANAALWSKVVPLLADRYRCIAPDWPMGSHSDPLDADADVSPPVVASMIGELIDHLGL